MADIEGQVWEALKAVRFPGMSRDIVSFGFVHQVRVVGDAVEVELVVSTHNPGVAEKVRADAERAVRGVAGVGGVQIALQVQRPPGPEPAARPPAQDSNLVPGVRHLVAVGEVDEAG